MSSLKAWRPIPHPSPSSAQSVTSLRIVPAPGYLSPYFAIASLGQYAWLSLSPSLLLVPSYLGVVATLVYFVVGRSNWSLVASSVSVSGYGLRLPHLPLDDRSRHVPTARDLPPSSVVVCLRDRPGGALRPLRTSTGDGLGIPGGVTRPTRLSLPRLLSGWTECQRRGGKKRGANFAPWIFSRNLPTSIDFGLRFARMNVLHRRGISKIPTLDLDSPGWGFFSHLNSRLASSNLKANS